ncbi:aminopeptidase N [Colwellia sp. BRX8-4]|uniref:aminopeptidase N n=1 Tax=unclassified Colwellia TaxID=196834 RepID=UPI0015F6D738|nr:MULTISPECIES: aminopeptidase N [unclassified Colwellia]MBA6352128.1 aminopeptidase N [Colwellia sp. BRX9-1]MBA6364321.1 aminopeptidase N [Colwellia sp. BRX8-8]MBA6372631.1 aminopeptidase N [Colwellia sp. BRX8-4]
MTLNKSQIAKALSIAIIGSSVALMGCEKADTASDSAVAETVQQQTSLLRTQSESLEAVYAEMRAKQVSNVSYKLSVTIDNKSESFSGSTELLFDLVENNQNDLTIDFDEGTIKSLKVNGKVVKFSYEKWFITIPASELTAGKQSITIDYQRPYSTDGSGFHRFVDPKNGEVYLYTDFEPYDANRLFPHFDQPDLKASYEIQVTAPAHWQIISATRETTISENGDNKVWSFPASARFSSYVFSLHAGNYAVWEDDFEGMKLRLFARQSLAEYVKTDEWFIPTKQSFAFFNKYFDVQYPFGKYDQIVAPDFNAGAMENVAAVTFNEGYIARGEKSTSARMSLANVIAHEMAHMWFGDLVTMRWWNGLWLNESFATYMANLAIAEASDFENNWDVFYSGTKQWAYRTDDSVNTHAIELPVASTGVALSNFDGITYGKGASVLKQLPYYLGEENFRIGVSNYLKKFSYQNTDLEDFIGELGKAAGKDMTQWTQDWLYNAGLNTIKVNYQCSDGKISAFAINQTAPEGYPTLREQRVQIGLYNVSADGNAMNLTSATPIMYKGATTEIKAVIGQACPDLVYPNEADWGYVKVDLDEKSLASAQQHINAIDNPTMRLMLWQSLSDSVNDANLAADQLVTFAMANIEGESDYNVSRKIASTLTSALGFLTVATRLEQKDYTALYMDVENLYLRLLENAEAGSDFQKLWYGRYVGVTKTTKHLNRLQNILNGEKSFDGITIDQDKRWTLIAKMNRYQHGNYQALLSTEAKKDITDSGVKSAIYAEVIRPEAEVKEKWFNIVINNPDKLKLSTLRYIMWGLFPGEQQALEAPYKAKILAHIPKLNEGSDLGLLESFAGSMLPTQCNAVSEAELAQLIKDYSGMKPQVLKTVKASHQQIGRCVKALELLK